MIKVNFYRVGTRREGANLCFISIFPLRQKPIIFVNFQN
uniref:Uncharacterized protein n=1 Tax=Serratia marcescens TaxID=615 RepID=A0A345IR05_SERMA|nr:hypothetical protein [Serratia marcescens]AXH02277.1 hypothetical protein [Serratia marcescens]